MYNYEQVLRWINAERRAHGYGPPLETIPKGVICKPENCPVANSFGNGTITDASRIWFDGEMDDPCELPDYIHEFIRDFDDGKIPELVIKESPKTETISPYKVPAPF